MMKLGKLPATHDLRTLKIVDFLDRDKLPPTPAEFRWSPKVRSWPMYMNDRLSCCVEAATGHAIQGWTAAAGAPITPNSPDVERMYEACGGYVPGNPSTDNGTNMLAAMKYWRKTGMAGQKIKAFASANYLNLNAVRETIFLFCGMNVGVQMPITAQTQSVWQVVDGGANSIPGSWGGHDVWAIDYNAIGPVVVTWGKLIQVTWAFWVKYVDETYAIISWDFVNAQTHLTGGGLKLQALDNAIEAVAA